MCVGFGWRTFLFLGGKKMNVSIKAPGLNKNWSVSDTALTIGNAFTSCLRSWKSKVLGERYSIHFTADYLWG